jgi:hypothetical protein
MDLNVLALLLVEERNPVAIPSPRATPTVLFKNLSILLIPYDLPTSAMTPNSSGSEPTRVDVACVED